MVDLMNNYRKDKRLKAFWALFDEIIYLVCIWSCYMILCGNSC